MSFSHKFRTCLIFLSLTCSLALAVPRLTVIFVVDQFAHHYVQRLKPYLRGGITTMLKNGIVYENAYYPHAMPATGTGHAALNTGCYAKDHGIISNKWYDTKGDLVYCDQDSPKNAAVFGPNGKLLNQGRSAKNQVVEGISDQIILNSEPGSKNKVFSISYKSRAAILAGGDAGKAIWFDAKTGHFTTSKAYFDSLPEWISDFNETVQLYKPQKLVWEQLHPEKTHAYDTANATNYKFSTKKSWLGKTIQIPDARFNKKAPFEKFTLLPQSNQTLLDLAAHCIGVNLSQNKKDKMVVWISITATDRLGHLFGPDSKEMFDLIYHLDRQMKQFMKKVEAFVRKADTMYVLTADHGIAPIPAIAHKAGIRPAMIINEVEWVKNLNKAIGKKYDVDNFIEHYRTPCFYFHQGIYNGLKKKKRKKIVKYLKKMVKEHPGIKTAWTPKKLLKQTFQPWDIESFYKNQYFPGRSGDLIVQVKPFCITTKYLNGTGHRSPYEYDTHVPLMFHQHGAFDQKTIYDRVSMLQFANTLANILEVPNAPASTFNILPGMFS